MTNLPPLPDPTMEASTLITAGGVFGAMFAVDQMLEYGALCRKEALEEAARKCADVCHPDTSSFANGYNQGALDCEEKSGSF